MSGLQDSLDRSWHDEDEFLEQHLESATGGKNTADLSSLALNLSSQAEYNNELLEYIRHLEEQLNHAQSSQVQQEVHIAEMQQRITESHERTESLQKQLNVTTGLYKDLTESHNELTSEMVMATTENDSLRVNVNELMQQKDMLQTAKDSSSERILQLEGELNDLRRRRLVSDDDNTDSITTLTITLEKANAELERERKLHYDVQLQASMLKDENIQLTRRLEHFVRVDQDEGDERESNTRKIREANSKISSLQQQISAVEAERDQFEQSLAVCRARLEESEESCREAVDNAHKKDLLWREMEEVSKQQQMESDDLKRQLALSMERVLALEKRLDNSSDKEKQLERMLKDEFDRKTESMLEKLEDQQEQLTRAQLRLEEVNDRNDDAMSSSAARIEELNGLLQATNEQLQASGDALKKEKADAASHTLQLEKIIYDLREQLRKAQNEEREAMKAKVQELVLAREQLTMRGERYSATLSGLHDAVHAIGTDATTLKEQLVYVYRQQEKLVTILTQMSSHNIQDFSEPRKNGDFKNNPVQGPLHIYCLELQSTLAALIEKIKNIQENHEATKKVAEERFAEIQQHQFEKEELRGKLRLSEETLSITRGKMIRLESQCEEAHRETRNIQVASQAERDKLTARLDKSENRLTDMIRQNTSVQADLRRVQAEAAAAHSEAEARYNLQSNKMIKIAAERDDAREREKTADARVSDLQNQLMQSDARIAKQQADYRKLKKISMSLKDDLIGITATSQQQIASLNQAMEQYRVQLQHKQQLMNTLQQQRNDLTTANERLHALVTELREEREISISRGSFVPPSSLEQLNNSRMRAQYYSSMKKTGHISSSQASSSRQALSGLAQLIHSSSSGGDSQHRKSIPTASDTLSVVHGTNIGSRAFNANLRHLTASLNPVEHENPDGSNKYRESGYVDKLFNTNDINQNDENFAHSNSSNNTNTHSDFGTGVTFSQRRYSFGSDHSEASRSDDLDGSNNIFRLTSPTKKKKSEEFDLADS